MDHHDQRINGLRVGELARRAGVTRKALRVYEAAGILTPAARTASGYRLYDDDAPGVLTFVGQAQRLGFTLAEIRDVLTIRRAGRPPCTHVHRLLQGKAVELDRKLRDLLDVRRRIKQSLAAWKRRPATRGGVCPHIETPAGGGRRRTRKG